MSNQEITENEKLLKQELIDYKNAVLRKLNVLEADMQKLIAENLRLIKERESSYVERDSCIALLAQMARKNGLIVGTVDKTVVLELGSGQVSWEFEESEAHLLEDLPPYDQPIEEIDISEKYRRVMNPALF